MTVFYHQLLNVGDKDADNYFHLGMELFNNHCCGCRAPKIPKHGVTLSGYDKSWSPNLLATDPDHAKYIPDPRIHFFDLFGHTPRHSRDRCHTYRQRKNVTQ